MERLRCLFGRIPEVFRQRNLENDQMLPLEGPHRKASKVARRIDNRYRLSKGIGLMEGVEKVFFVDCCLAREVVLAEVAEISRKQEEADRARISRGFSARLVIKARELELKPVRSTDEAIKGFSFDITGELFGNSLMSRLIDNKLCPREQKFRIAKRQFLGSIISASHLLYPLVVGNLRSKEKLEAVANTCQRQRPWIDTERAKVVAFLRDPSLYNDVFPGHRTGRFSNGTMEPIHFLMID